MPRVRQLLACSGPHKAALGTRGWPHTSMTRSLSWATTTASLYCWRIHNFQWTTVGSETDSILRTSASTGRLKRRRSRLEQKYCWRPFRMIFSQPDIWNFLEAACLQPNWISLRTQRVSTENQQRGHYSSIGRKKSSLFAVLFSIRVNKFATYIDWTVAAPDIS